MRNLGWIFLFVFFLFMLFIIASNNPERGENQWWVQVEVDWENTQWADPVDLLIERLEEEAREWQQDWTWDEITSVWTEEIWTTWSLREESWESEHREDERVENQWFFARLFWTRSQTNDEEDELWTDTEVIEDRDDNWHVDNESEEYKSDTTDTAVDKITQEYRANQTSWNLVRTWTQQQQIYVPQHQIESSETRSAIYMSDVWDIYSVNTHSLRLNNKNFSETLWFLMRDDTLRQISEINAYWCFEAEVVESATAMHRSWFVCQRYLSLLTSTDEGLYTQSTDEYIDIAFAYPETQIWDIIEIEVQQINIFDMALFQWDSIEQISEVDDGWCFTAIIHSVQFAWYTNLLGQSYQFCLDDILILR